MSLQDKEHHMNYPKSLLSIMVCASLMCAGTIARPIKMKKATKQSTTIKKKTPLKRKPTKTQSARPNKTVQPVINVTLEPSKWFTLGQTDAEKLIMYAVDPNVSVDDFNKTEYSKLPDDFAHKQEYFKGMKQGLSTFTPIAGNDITTNQKSRLIQYFQIAADCWLEAKKFNEVEKIFSVKIKEFQEHVLSTMSPAELGYEYGNRHGKWVCMAIMLQSPGDACEDKITNAYKTHDESFFTAIEKYSEKEKKEATGYYFRGIEESLKTLNIDEALENTPQDKIDELRQQYHAALKEAQERSASYNTEAKNK